MPANLNCSFITGLAGSGKSTGLKARLALDPESYVLCSTTGLSSINLGVATLNSTLKFYDTDSLMDSYVNGKLYNTVKRLVTGSSAVRGLACDEVSMLAADQLDMIHDTFKKVASREDVTSDLEIVLCGDFCFGLGTKIMMSDGSVKSIEDIQIGESVMGPDSKPRKVLNVCSGFDEMFEVEQTNGDTYVINSKHPIVLKRGNNGTRVDGCLRYRRHGDDINLTASEFMKKSEKFKGVFVGYKAGTIDLPSRMIKLDPYFLGLWLGDGDSDGPRITSMDPEVIEYCQAYADIIGLTLKVQDFKRTPVTKAKRLSLTKAKRGNTRNPIISELRTLNLLNNKHIPEDYLLNTEQVRLRMLAGLLDSDGNWGGNRYSIASSKPELARQIKQLADGLGFRTNIRTIAEHPNCQNITIGGDTWRIPCKIARKISLPRNLGRSRLTSVLEVNAIGRGIYAGIEIDGDSLFLLADGTVVHNCQLSPINAKFAFEAKCWPEFEANTLKLDKVYRQDNMVFLEALNEFRAGRGRSGVDLLKKCGVTFHDKLIRFDGTTIVPKNDAADSFNKVKFNELDSEIIKIPAIRLGIQSSDWKDPKIPDVLEIKLGAMVMILSNDTVYKTYANGDQGIVEGIDRTTGMVQVRILSSLKERNGLVVWVAMVKREFKDNLRDPFTGELKKVKEIAGTIEYMPLRLSYASTVHRSQGLTLDNVQIDFRDRFFGNPGMMYVALSRCRTPEGLRLVGSEETMVKRTVVNQKVKRFL